MARVENRNVPGPINIPLDTRRVYSVDDRPVEVVNDMDNKIERMAEEVSVEEGGRLTGLRDPRFTNVRIAAAEFLGTLVLVFVGCGANAQATIGGSFFGSIVSVYTGWGLGITMGILISGQTSGGHINPAVSLAMACFKKIRWIQLPFYFAGQYLGAFCGAALVFMVYYSKLQSYAETCSAANDGVLMSYALTSGPCATAGIFSTFPSPDIPVGQAFVDQLMSAAIFIMLIFAITDKHNGNIPGYLYAFLIGLCVTALISGYGYNAGCALNPARDLGPRIFTAIAGWGGEPFSFRSGTWFFVPILAPSLGGILGGFAYFALVGQHLPRLKE